MMRTSQPGWNAGAIALSASRSRRRTRLRTTAPPSARPVDSPKRVVSRSVRRNRAVRSGWDRVVPPPWNAAKSCGRESITSRGVFVPRPIVRPSAAFGREHGAWPGPAGRRPTSSWRGSRAPWRGGASWADRSASSGLSGILSIRPRGRSVATPERHANAPGARKRTARRRPADDMSGPGGCQTNGRRSRAPATPRRSRSAHRILQGSIGESPCDGRPAGAILSGPSTPETYAGAPGSPVGTLGNASTGASQWLLTTREIPAPDSSPVVKATHPPPLTNRRIPSTNGREAGLASGSGGAAGLALPGQF